jgi:hypothetical protein
MSLFDDESHSPGPDSPDVTITPAYQTTREGGGEFCVGFEKGLGGPTIPDGTPVLANRPPVIDTHVSEGAVRVPVGPMLSSPGRGEGRLTGSRKGAMLDFGGLVDPSRLCSSPVLSGSTLAILRWGP